MCMASAPAAPPPVQPIATPQPAPPRPTGSLIESGSPEAAAAARARAGGVDNQQGDGPQQGTLVGQSRDVSATAPFQARDTFGRTPRERVATVLESRGQPLSDRDFQEKKMRDSVRFGGGFFR